MTDLLAVLLGLLAHLKLGVHGREAGLRASSDLGGTRLVLKAVRAAVVGDDVALDEEAGDVHGVNAVAVVAADRHGSFRVDIAVDDLHRCAAPS